MSPKDTAYIVERLAFRFMSMVADYERKLVEHRDAFGVRTSADARIIEGMRAELQEARRNACLPGESLNEAITRTDRELDTAREQRDSIQVERDALRAEVADLRGIFDMVHASLGIKQGDHIGNAIAALKQQSVTTPKRSHPVKDGEWVRNSDGGLAQVLEVHKDWYLVARGHGWPFANCEPCDPPVDHDTPAGKEAAESVIRDFRSGDSEVSITGLFDDTKITVRREPDQDHGSRIVIRDANDMGEANIYLTESGARQMATALIGLCDVRKVPQ